MTENRIHHYEGMFLFPPSVLGDLQGAVDHITGILHRAGAEIISLRKWDERRLAYEVKGNKRGVYFLVYFRAPAAKIAGVERDCNLSETFLRYLITRADHVLPEIMEATDGRAALADEIKLRAIQPAEEPREVAEPVAAAVAAEELQNEEFGLDIEDDQ